MSVAPTRAATPALPWYRLAGYGALGIPLAMAELPVYVHLPKYYSDAWGLNLAVLGLVLLLVRVLDAVQDPLLGLWSDHHVARGGQRSFFVWLGVPLMVIGMFMLFAPQVGDSASVLPWLVSGMIVVYFGFSVLTVSYQAWGSELSADPHERTRVTAWRTGLAIIGVVLAAALPVTLSKSLGVKAGYAQFAIVFAVVAVIATIVTLTATPKPAIRPPMATGSVWARMKLPLKNRAFRWLLAIFVFNGVAASIPATLVLFFIADVVKRPDLEAVFLISYFAAAALGLPLWVALSRHIGKVKAWLVGMALAVAAFVWASGLGAGDWFAFLIICGLSGVALGADLALPPSILADVIDRDEAAGHGRSEGAYFGLWALVTKLNLALAAGIALPLVRALGYTPATPAAQSSDGLLALAIVYAALPCALKLVAAAVLWRAPIYVKG